MSKFKIGYAQCMPFRRIDKHLLIRTTSWRCVYRPRIDEHLLIQTRDAGFVLLDTGSPKSFKRGDAEISILMDKISDNNDGLLEEISRHIGCQKIIGLIGSDILKDKDVSIDPLSETIIFSQPIGNDAHYKGVKTDIGMTMEIPTIEFEINGKKHTAFIDTGARLNYISPEFTKNIKPAQKGVKDFYPLLGRFDTDVYCLEISIGSEPITMNFGTLPPPLQAAIGITGINSIIGSEILKTFAMHISIAGRFIILARIEQPILPEYSKERWLQRFKATPSMYLTDSLLMYDFEHSFAGDKDIIAEIEKRSAMISEGAAHEYLKNLLVMAETGKGVW